MAWATFAMHDTELTLLSLSKPGTRQQKFKDMFPLLFRTISLYLHGGKSVKFLGG